MDSDDHVLCVHLFRQLHWRRQSRMAHDFWAAAMFLLPLHLQVVPENHRFLFCAEQFRWESIEWPNQMHFIRKKKTPIPKFAILLVLLTCFLNSCTSSGVIVSALAMTGIILTLSHNRCMNSMSNGLRPCAHGAIKYRHVCTRLSYNAFRWTLDSAVKNSSYLASTKSMIGTQQLLLSIASPKPGVSTTVNVKLTPFSFNSTFVVSTATVFLIRCDGPGCWSWL